MMRYVLIFLLFVFIVACLAALGYSVYYFFFMENNAVVPAFEEGGTKLVIEGEMIISRDQPKVVDEEILLPLSVIKNHIDKYIYWDDSTKKVTITTRDRVIRMKTGSLEAFVNDKPMELNIPAVEEKGTVFVPIEFLSDFYNIEITYLEENDVIIIDFENSIRQIAEPIDPKAVVRKGRSTRYPILKTFDLENGEAEENSMRIFEEYDKWYKVRTADGIIGYIEKKYVVVRRILVKEMPKDDGKTPDWKPGDGKVNLVWEMMYSSMPDLSKIGKMPGLDVISPTWFQLKNKDGDIINRSVPRFVEWAHENGYKVWALFANDSSDIEMTESFLNNTDARENAIRAILAYASLYKLDGINIDFENMYKKDKDAFTQFVREITPLLKEQGLVVSVDVTIPDGSDTWSLCYDRKALGEVVDYVALMTYDQHWATSPVAGSVAQLQWVEKNVKKVLEMVPAEKLLLGLPFYTRLWEEATDANGKVKVTSPRVLSMTAAAELLRENGATPVWDEVSGQFYAEYKKDGKTYKVWLEDVNSINLKSSLVHKYKLAGTAAWSRNYVVPEIWEVLNENLKGIKTYSEWKEKNNGRQYVYAPLAGLVAENK